MFQFVETTGTYEYYLKMAQEEAEKVNQDARSAEKEAAHKIAKLQEALYEEKSRLT